VLSTMGSPSIDWNGAGNGVYYNSAIINQNFTNAGYFKMPTKGSVSRLSRLDHISAPTPDTFFTPTLKCP
jgi:hypothetical protein